MSLDDDDYEDVECKSDEDEFQSDEERQREDNEHFIHFNDHHDRLKAKSSHYQHKNNIHSQPDLSAAIGLDGKRLRVLRKIATILRPQLSFKADLDSDHDLR